MILPRPRYAEKPQTECLANVAKKTLSWALQRRAVSQVLRETKHFDPPQAWETAVQRLKLLRTQNAPFFGANYRRWSPARTCGVAPAAALSGTLLTCGGHDRSRKRQFPKCGRWHRPRALSCTGGQKTLGTGNRGRIAPPNREGIAVHPCQIARQDRSSA